MHYSLVPSERDFMVDACDALYRRAHSRFNRHKHCEDILEEGGIELLLDVIKLWTQDEVMVRAAVRALTPLAKDTGDEAEHILELGGRAIMDEIQQLHRQDNDVLKECKQLLNVLTKKGSAIAVKEMRKLMVAMDYIKNQTLINNLLGKEHGAMSVADEVKEELKPHLEDDGEKAAKMKHGDEHDMLTWLYTLDYQKVTVTIAAHMSRYHSELSVQEAGCEAWQEYAATATDLRPVLTSGGCGAVVKALEKFKAKRRLVWKGLMAVAQMASHEILCSELGKRGAIATVVDMFHTYENDVPLQQQALWSLDALSTYDTNVERFSQNGVIPILHELLVVIPKYGKKQKGSAKDKKKADKEAKDPAVAENVIIPYRLRKLYTVAELIEGAKPPKPEKKEKKKKIELRPKPKKTKFGRVGDDPSWKGEGNSEGLDLDKGSEVEEALKNDKSMGNPYLSKDGKTVVNKGAIVPVNMKGS